VKFLVALFLIAFGTGLIQSSYAQQQAELETTSEQGTFLIRISWIENGLEEDHTFNIEFIEPETGAELEDIQYNFMIVNEDNEQVVRRVDQISSEQKALFDEVGPYTITIGDIEGLGEDATLPILVTPEFSAMLPILAALAVVAAIVVVRINGTNLFKFKV
jgi:hypothetical protein